MWDLLILIISTGILPVIINKSTESGKLDWIKGYLRPIWTAVFVFYSIYIMQKPLVMEVIMEWHKKWNSTPLIGYLICGFVGAFILCGYWWFAGKMFTSSTNNKQQSSALKQPTAEEIAAEVAKRIPGFTPESQISPPLPFKEKIEEPVFREKVEKATVSLGGGGITQIISIASLESGKKEEPFNFGSYKPLMIYMEKGKLFVDVFVFGGYGQPPIEVKHNTFVLRIPGWDRNFDSAALEIVNNDKVPVFQLIYRTPYQIVINGIFPSPSGLMLASNDGFIGNALNVRKGFRITRLFKYPSIQFPGRREEPLRIIPGPDLKRRAISLSAELSYFVEEREKLIRAGQSGGENLNKIVLETISIYDDRFALKCAGIAEELEATGLNVGRLPSIFRHANNPHVMKESAEELRRFAERLP